jgi:tape measure domain-containing protein
MAYDGTLKFDTSIDATGFQKGANTLDNIVKGLGVFELIKTGMQMVVASIDGAVSRYDTLNRFPEIMENIGFSAGDSADAVQRLSDGVTGLPTALDEVVGKTQRIAAIKDDLDLAVDTTLALNDAFLASGSGAEGAARGSEQYIQMLSSGKVDMMSWRTLQETMPYALKETAEAFGFTGDAAQSDFYAALQNGDITFDQFNAKLIELDGGVGGFAETAKTASSGINTAFTNMNTGIVRGVTGVIDSIDQGLSKTRFESIENVISDMGTGVEAALGVVAGAFGFVAENADWLVPSIAAVFTAFAAYKVVNGTAKAFNDFSGTVKAAQAVIAGSQALIVMDTTSHTLLTAALASETTAENVRAAAKAKGMTIDAAGNLITATGTAATAAETASVLASSGALTAKTVIVGLLTGGIGLATAAQWLWNAAMTASPIGAVIAVIVLAIAAIAALVVGIISLVSWLENESEEYKKQKEEMDELKKAHEEYEDQLDADKDAAEENIKQIEAQSDANNDLVDDLRKLMSTNDKAGKNNGDIKKTIDRLNGSVEGLGISYDDTTGKLSTSIEEVEAYVEAQGELAEIEAQEDEYNRLLDEQVDLRAKINTEQKRQTELAEMLANEQISQNEYNELIKQSNELLADYSETYDQLSTDVETAYSSIDQEAKISAQNQINAFDAINGAVDDEGNNLKQLAHKYKTTTDDILAEMKEQNINMAEWSAKNAELYTKDGQSLQGVANQWGYTKAEVEAYMDEWGLSLDDFAEHMEDTHTKEGLSLEDLAARWGLTTEEINTQMDNMGLNMQEWSDLQDENFDKQKEAWAEYEDSIKEHAAGVINGFEEIPAEYDKTADELIEILIKNKERYAEWEIAMEEITRQLGPTAAAELGKLGPGATSAIQAMLDSTDRLDVLREVFGVKIDEATGEAIENLNDPLFIGAPAAALNEMAERVRKNTAVSDAVEENLLSAKAKAVRLKFPEVGKNIMDSTISGIKTASQLSNTMNQELTTAKAAAEKVDFTSVGKRISESIVSGIKGADVQGAMQEVTGAIQNNSGMVTGAMDTLATGITGAMDTARTGAADSANEMMTDVNSAIVSRTGTVKSSTSALVNGAVAVLDDLPVQGEALAEQTMAGINSAIVTRTNTVKTSATALVNGVVDKLQALVSGATAVTNSMMDGMRNAMSNKAPQLYALAQEIANNIATTIAVALQVHSPSRVMMRIFGFVMDGIYKGMADKTGMLYHEADTIANGLAEHLAMVHPSTVTELYGRLQSLVSSNPLGGTTLIPQAAYAGASGSTTYSTTLNQNITTPKPLSASEMTREGQDMLRRQQWQLP